MLVERKTALAVPTGEAIDLDRRGREWYVDKVVSALVFLGGTSAIVLIIGIFVFITREDYSKLNDDEAALVLGPEMSHIDLNHYQKQLRRARTAAQRGFDRLRQSGQRRRRVLWLEAAPHAARGSPRR